MGLSSGGVRVSWHHALPHLVNICAQLLWPRCALPTFQHFLLSGRPTNIRTYFIPGCTEDRIHVVVKMYTRESGGHKCCIVLSACQFMQIQEYVRLLSTWCDWNCHSRQFLLGSALMNMGEPEKASDWMVQVASLLNQYFVKRNRQCSWAKA